MSLTNGSILLFRGRNPGINHIPSTISPRPHFFSTQPSPPVPQDSLPRTMPLILYSLEKETYHFHRKLLKKDIRRAMLRWCQANEVEMSPERRSGIRRWLKTLTPLRLQFVALETRLPLEAFVGEGERDTLRFAKLRELVAKRNLLHKAYLDLWKANEKGHGKLGGSGIPKKVVKEEAPTVVKRVRWVDEMVCPKQECMSNRSRWEAYARARGLAMLSRSQFEEISSKTCPLPGKPCAVKKPAGTNQEMYRENPIKSIQSYLSPYFDRNSPLCDFLVILMIRLAVQKAFQVIGSAFDKLMAK